MSVFENKQYPTIMYLAMILVCMLILLSFVNMTENLNNKTLSKQQSITGNVIENSEQGSNLPNESTPVPAKVIDKKDLDKEISKEAELYTLESYGIFYTILIIIGILIVIFTGALILPKVKHLT